MGDITGAFDFFCSVMMLTLTIFLFRDRHETPLNRLFFFLSFDAFAMVFFRGLLLLALPKEGALFVVAHMVSYGAYYILGALFTRYVHIICEIDSRFYSALRVIAYMCCGVGAIIWVSTCVDPFLFDIKTQVYVNRGVLFHMTSALMVIPLIINVIYIFSSGIWRRSTDFVAMVLFPVIPLFSSIPDKLFPGLYSRYALIILAVFINYLAVVRRQQSEYREEMAHMEQYRLLSTLERIKPHYIYNVLASISVLCEIDPKKAQEAIDIFSDFLRSVLAKMNSSNSLVDFEEELKTVKNYIALEKMRFGDRFNVTFETGAVDFRLPPFTLQPLVENSVKHGVADLDVPGEITISSYEDEYGYVISVRDNGKGFDPAAEGDSFGEGMQYISDILELTVGGSLSIDSRVGEGTRSTIYIPREKAKAGAKSNSFVQLAQTIRDTAKKTINIKKDKGPKHND